MDKKMNAAQLIGKRLTGKPRLPVRILVLVLAFGLSACAAGPPPAQIADARLALEDARRAKAEDLATRPYDEAVRHLSVAESTWNERRDSATAIHWARRAEAAAREAQYQAEIRTAEEAIRRETERLNRAEIAVRDAEIGRLQSQARTDAERRAAEAEARALEEQRAREEEQERRQLATEQARREAEGRMEAEATAREDRQRLEEELQRREGEAEQARREADAERQRLEEQRRAEEARAQDFERLRAEHQQAQEELRTTLSRLAEVRQEARGLVVTLPGSIYFEVNKAVIQPAMRSRLTEIGRALATAEDSAILIEGHTDSDGSNEYNLELSRLRAEAVRSVLVGGGVPPDRVQTLGYGETRPIASNASASGKAQNRRVEIVLQGSAAAPNP